jgi:hypothetical protein
MVEVHRVRPDGWLAIRPTRDSFSWLFARHVKLLDGGLAEVNKDGVASRIGSRLGDERNAVQVRLKRGEVVEILGEQTDDGKKWYKVAPPAGEFRWIHQRDVTQREPAHRPVVTVSNSSENVPDGTADIQLAAETGPVATEIWRASPLGTTANSTSQAPVGDVAAPPLAAVVNPLGDESKALEKVPSESQSTAAPPGPNDALLPQPTPNPNTPTENASTRRLTELEMRLSRIVAEPPATWQIEPLESELEQLLGTAQTVAERNAIQITLSKVDRFASIGRRYRQMAPDVARSLDRSTMPTAGIPFGAGAGDPRTTADIASGSQPSAAGQSIADGGQLTEDSSRYDAVGVLRPVVSKRPGAPQFALLNDRGQVVSFVTPTPDVNLQPYVGHRVGITGTRGFIPEFQRAHVTAGRVAPLDNTLLR